MICVQRLRLLARACPRKHGSQAEPSPRLGALNLFAAVIFGQILCSVVLDHYGVLYKEHSLSAGRLAGVVLLGAGVALVRFY